jgi:hypothetical protein
MEKIRKYREYKRLKEYQKELIYKMHEEKMKLRKIARVMGVELRTIQYHIKKKCKNIENCMRIL